MLRTLISLRQARLHTAALFWYACFIDIYSLLLYRGESKGLRARPYIWLRFTRNNMMMAMRR